MNCDSGFLHIFGIWTVPVCLLRIRGKLAIGVHLRAIDLYAVGSFDPDHDAVMRIGGEAPGAGPFSRSASSAMFEYGFPPPRIVNSAVRRKASASTEQVKGILFPAFSLPDAG
jgi:hypothetical protein